MRNSLTGYNQYWSNHERLGSHAFIDMAKEELGIEDDGGYSQEWNGNCNVFAAVPGPIHGPREIARVGFLNNEGILGYRNNGNKIAGRQICMINNRISESADTQRRHSGIFELSDAESEDDEIERRGRINILPAARLHGPAQISRRLFLNSGDIRGNARVAFLNNEGVRGYRNNGDKFAERPIFMINNSISKSSDTQRQHSGIFGQSDTESGDRNNARGGVLENKEIRGNHNGNIIINNNYYGENNPDVRKFK